MPATEPATTTVPAPATATAVALAKSTAPALTEVPPATSARAPAASATKVAAPVAAAATATPAAAVAAAQATPTQAPAAAASASAAASPAPATGLASLLPGVSFNPMDLLTASPLSAKATATATAAPAFTAPALTTGPEAELVERNTPVLFEVYSFYAFHAAAVRTARQDGHAAPLGAADVAQQRALAAAPDQWDTPVLSQPAFQQLLRDFKLMAGRVTDPAVAALLLPEPALLTYRHFVRLLVALAEIHQPRFSRDKALLSLLETMDYSEQLYIISELFLNTAAFFDVSDETWRSSATEPLK